MAAARGPRSSAPRAAASGRDGSAPEELVHQVGGHGPGLVVVEIKGLHGARAQHHDVGHLLHPQVLIADLLAGDPNAARVLDQEFGLPCYRCPARWVETLESGITYSEIPAARVLDRLRALRSLAGETQVVGEVAPEASPSPSEDPS